MADRRGIVTLVEQFAERDEVAEGLRHLLALDEQVPAMHPMANKRTPSRGLRLGDLVLVMGEDEVLTTEMHVERFAQLGDAHYRALEMPTRPTTAPGRVPRGFDLLVLSRCCLPQREVARVLLVVLVVRNACAHLERRGIDALQPSVLGKAGDGEIHSSVVRRIGVPTIDQPLYEIDHRANVVGRPRVALCGADAERARVCEKGLAKRRGLLGDGYSGLDRGLDDLVVNVREVHDEAHFVATPIQVPVHEVEEQKRPEIADVRVVVDRGAATVDTYDTRFERLEGLERSRGGVVDLERHANPGLCSGASRVWLIMPRWGPLRSTQRAAPSAPQPGHLPW